MDLTLAPGILEKLIANARESLPQEGCGLIAGGGGVGERFVPISNALASELAYEMDPGQLIAALRSLRESGESMVAIYHSHPGGPATPSRRDVEQAYYPKAAHVIVSMEDRARPDVRAFRIVDGEVLEIGLHVIV